MQESYLYDDNGIRVKRTTGSTSTYYPFAHYEISGSTTIKYYFFGGMRIAMMNGSTFSYLHADHPSTKLRTSLGSTVLETNTSGNLSADQKYRAYGNQRDSGPVVTDHKFTGQKHGGTGLYYYNARSPVKNGIEHYSLNPVCTPTLRSHPATLASAPQTPPTSPHRVSG